MREARQGRKRRTAIYARMTLDIFHPLPKPDFRTGLQFKWIERCAN